MSDELENKPSKSVKAKSKAVKPKAHEVSVEQLKLLHSTIDKLNLLYIKLEGNQFKNVDHQNELHIEILPTLRKIANAIGDKK